MSLFGRLRTSWSAVSPREPCPLTLIPVLSSFLKDDIKLTVCLNDATADILPKLHPNLDLKTPNQHHHHEALRPSLSRGPRHTPSICLWSCKLPHKLDPRDLCQFQQPPAVPRRRNTSHKTIRSRFGSRNIYIERYEQPEPRTEAQLALVRRISYLTQP